MKSEIQTQEPACTNIAVKCCCCHSKAGSPHGQFMLSGTGALLTHDSYTLASLLLERGGSCTGRSLSCRTCRVMCATSPEHNGACLMFASARDVTLTAHNGSCSITAWHQHRPNNLLHWERGNSVLSLQKTNSLEKGERVMGVGGMVSKEQMNKERKCERKREQLRDTERSWQT